MSYFAVLDTETTWSDEVMSLGFVIADEDGFEEVCGEYYIKQRVSSTNFRWWVKLWLVAGVRPVPAGIAKRSVL